MKILEKTVMPDGTPIQLEDWSDRNTPEYPNLYGLMIGAYPKQKRGCCNPYPYPGREFRISIDQNRCTSMMTSELISWLWLMARRCWKTFRNTSGTGNGICGVWVWMSITQHADRFAYEGADATAYCLH